MSTAVPHFASGGSFVVGGNSGTDRNMMSINGKPVAMVNKGETVAMIPGASRMSFGGSGVQQIELVIHSAPSDDAWAKVEQVSARTVGRATPVVIRMARDAAVRDITRPRLMNGRG